MKKEQEVKTEKIIKEKNRKKERKEGRSKEMKVSLTPNRNALFSCRMSVMAEMQVGASELPDLVHTDRAAEPQSVKHTQTHSSHTHTAGPNEPPVTANTLVLQLQADMFKSSTTEECKNVCVAFRCLSLKLSHDILSVPNLYENDQNDCIK